MIYSNENWLPHLQVPTKAYGNNLSMYSVALEGWRRGLNLTFFTEFHDDKFEIQYALKSAEREHKFQISKGDRVTEEAVNLCKNKGLNKDHLKNENIPVPYGASFSKEHQVKDVTEFAEKVGYPVVLKPADGKLGRGVFTNITNQDQLVKAFHSVRDELGYDDVLVEKFIKGKDYRIYVINEKVLSVIERVPANIVGDGTHTIEDLIKLKNRERKNNPNLSTRSIKIDKQLKEHLQSMDYALDTVLKEGEQVFVRSKSNISSGGDPIDVTDDFPENLKEIAIEATRSIPGLPQCGLDMIVDEDGNGYILEMNTRPGIGSHLFPSVGDARDIPSAIIDYYFPETIGKEKHNFYFDFNQVYEVLRKGLLSEVVISPLSDLPYVVRQFEAYGDTKLKRFDNWLQKHTLNLNIHGYAKNLDNGLKQIVIYGNQAKVERFVNLLQKQVPLMSSRNSLGANTPLKSGFEIMN